MLKAIEKVNADTIFIFPNNKNIILAANQAKVLTKGKEVIVMPTKTVPQGISAMINYNAELSVKENEEAMKESIQLVKTGQITYAVRDTHIEDKEIRQGDIMGIGDSSILAVGQDIQKVSEETVEKMLDEESELISIYYGSEVKQEQAEALRNILAEKWPDCEVEVYSGGQPIYYYVISVE